MKIALMTAVLMAISATAVNAAERYTEARIIQVETSDSSVLVFLQLISGDAPPLWNGLTNQPTNQYSLYLANTPTDIANRKHLLASALAAHAAGFPVRIRWEDSGPDANRIVALLVRE